MAKQINFEKNRLCSLCGATGEELECFARKYIAMKGKSAYVYHYGQHQCRAKLVQQRQAYIIAQAMKPNPTIRPSAIQSETVLIAMRSREPLDQVFNIARNVTDRQKISNEKIKQTKLQQPNGTSFEGIREYKKYTDSYDKLLVPEISDSEQYVFKTSQEKTKIANEMCNVGPPTEEFCYFDGKVKRNGSFTSLTASAYYPFLHKQTPLATMECKAEDSRHVAQFWKLFNNSYKEANETENKFGPTGWCTDMAAANMNGLRDVYGYDVISKVKGCEFRYSQSVEKHSKKFKSMTSICLKFWQINL